MQAAAAKGIADGGADVVELGLVGTEMLYHAVAELGLDGGICVTASHNPKEYTGMKIVRRGALPVGGDSGLAEMRARAEAGFGQATAGAVRSEDIWPSFVAKVLSFVDVDAIRPLRVVIDAANGMAGAMLPPVLEQLPQLDVVRCYFEPDGSFPNHEPNPLLPENREFIVAKVTEEAADLGVAYDGDADRCFFVDDTGEFVPGDFATALMAEAVLAKAPGEKVIYDVRASWAVPETIERAGGVPLVNRVGHAFIKQRMRAEGAVFAGEVSAHYYFREFSQADTGVVPFLVMLELVSRSGMKLSELLRPYRERFFLTGEINTPVVDVPLKLQELKERYAAEGGRVSHLDGISFEFDDWHFNVRPSNTEPLLRLNLEALSESRMVEKRDEVLGVIRPRVTDAPELGRVTDRRPPFKYSALTRVWFSDTDAQGVVYYGRYLPYFDHARTEYHRHLGAFATPGREFVMRASAVEYHAPARFDDLIEAFVRVGRIGRSSMTYECAAYRLPDDTLMVTAGRRSCSWISRNADVGAGRAAVGDRRIRGGRSRGVSERPGGVRHIVGGRREPTTSSAGPSSRPSPRRDRLGGDRVRRGRRTPLGPADGEPDEPRTACPSHTRTPSWASSGSTGRSSATARADRRPHRAVRPHRMGHGR